MKRNRAISGLLAGTVAAILLGSAASLWFGIEAKESEARAKQSAARAKRSEARAKQSEAEALASAEESRRNLYVGHMNLVQRNWESNEMWLVRDLLNRYGPECPMAMASLRGFEWYYFDRL